MELSQFLCHRANDDEHVFRETKFWIDQCAVFHCVVLNVQHVHMDEQTNWDAHGSFHHSKTLSSPDWERTLSRNVDDLHTVLQRGIVHTV